MARRLFGMLSMGEDRELPYVTLVVQLKRISSRSAQCDPSPTGVPWNVQRELEHGSETDDSE